MLQPSQKNQVSKQRRQCFCRESQTLGFRIQPGLHLLILFKEQKLASVLSTLRRYHWVKAGLQECPPGTWVCLGSTNPQNGALSAAPGGSGTMESRSPSTTLRADRRWSLRRLGALGCWGGRLRATPPWATALLLPSRPRVSESRAVSSSCPRSHGGTQPRLLRRRWGLAPNAARPAPRCPRMWLSPTEFVIVALGPSGPRVFSHQ